MTVPSQLIARNYHGNRPCLPAEALLAVCRRIFSKPTTQP